MRNNILFVFIIMMISVAASAQNISIGTEIGVLSSKNSDYLLMDVQNRRNSFNVGLNVNYIFSEKLSLTSGFHYLRLGYRHKTCYEFEPGVKNQLVGKLDYIAIPLIANIYFLKSRKLYTSFGFHAAYNFQALQDYPNSIGGCELYYMRDLKPTTREFNLLGVTGVGFKLVEHKNSELSLMLKYFQGLNNSFQSDLPININRKSSAFALNILYNFKA